MTKVNRFGWKVGDKGRVKGDDSSHDFALGSIVTLVYDDGTNSPRFQDGDGERRYVYYKDLEKLSDEPTAKVNEYGWKVGDKGRVKAGAGHSGIVGGSVVTFAQDDGTDCPYFTTEGSGRRVAFFYDRIEKIEGTPEAMNITIDGKVYDLVARPETFKFGDWVQDCDGDKYVVVGSGDPDSDGDIRAIAVGDRVYTFLNAKDIKKIQAP